LAEWQEERGKPVRLTSSYPSPDNGLLAVREVPG